MKKKETSDTNNNTSLKQIIINAPEGKIIDINHFNESGNVRFIDDKPSVIEFPTKWSLDHLKKGVYISTSGVITQTSHPHNGDSNQNILPNRHLAKQMLIFHQLITMRERYREIEELNNPKSLKNFHKMGNEMQKHVCYIVENDIKKADYLYTLEIFSFQLEETRDAFAANFREMILQCKDLLG